MRTKRLALLYRDSGGISLSLYIVTSRKDHGLAHRAALIVFPGIRQLCQHYCQRKYRFARVNFSQWRSGATPLDVSEFSHRLYVVQHLVYDQSPDIPRSWYDENAAGRANCRVSNAPAVRAGCLCGRARATHESDGALTFREYRDGSANKSQLSPLPRNYLETWAPAETH